MSTYSLLNDYSEGCHPRILEALSRHNLEQLPAYGDDPHSEAARQLIRAQIGTDDMAVHFVTGGTMANLLIASAALRPHEAAIAAESGHIATHETGAIEATGHRVITVPTTDGKLTPAHVAQVLDENSLAPHMTKPKLVYISNATELGTVFTKAELTALSQFCRDHDLLLQMDGARMGTGLMSDACDLTLSDLAALTDAFWIGGAKNGALLGEAVVLPNPDLARDFAFIMKQRGSLLAKGRMLGLQFQVLFTDDLYFDLARHANRLARKLADGISAAGYDMLAPAVTNQIFPILPNDLIARLQEDFGFYVWETVDDKHSAVRLVTSWATEDEKIEAFLTKLNA